MVIHITSKTGMKLFYLCVNSFTSKTAALYLESPKNLFSLRSFVRGARKISSLGIRMKTTQSLNAKRYVNVQRHGK